MRPTKIGKINHRKIKGDNAHILKEWQLPMEE
jgi:hypothetical protein